MLREDNKVLIKSEPKCEQAMVSIIMLRRYESEEIQTEINKYQQHKRI